MTESVTVQKLYDDNAKRLGLEWIAGHKGAQRFFTRRSTASGSPTLVGYFNLIHTNQTQVLGKTELKYIKGMRKNWLRDACNQLFESRSVVIMITDGQHPPDRFLKLADHYQIALIKSKLSSYEILTNLRYYFTQKLAERITLHGVFMEVLSLGVLLTGESGTGKSELALELITRGQRLIADDAPEFARITPETINGSCPSLLQDFLEVRGLGVLNIRTMYGDAAIKINKYLRLIVHLTPLLSNDSLRQDRLQIKQKMYNILGVDIPIFSLPVAPGRNLAVLVEAAVRNHMLRLNGYNAGEDLAARQRRQMQ
ncbi:MAG: HPr(Ser) kinase/phosphatase [Gammaproteobacteria bacterium]|nr:HPr(Ser) kinase/phosphatase [Gammaproteobacteria bacterium]